MDSSRAGAQIVRVGVAEVDELVLHRLGNFGALNYRVYRILSCKDIVNVAAIDSRRDVWLVGWLDLLRQELLEVDYTGLSAAMLHLTRDAPTTLEEGVLLDLFCTIRP